MAKEVNIPESANSTAGTGELYPNAEVRTDTDDADGHGNSPGLEQIKIIPEVRKCDWAGYKNHFQAPEKGIYAVDVLESDAGHNEEIQEELKRRDSPSHKRGRKKSITLKPTSLQVADVQMNVLEAPLVQPEAKEITRIRIQSPAILMMLAKFMQETWDTRPRSFYRPFHPLIHFLPRVSEALEEMENRHDDQSEPIDKSASPAGSSDPSKGADNEHVDKDSDKNWESALAEVKCYVQFMQHEILPIYHQFEGLSAEDNPRVTFSDLWCLFRLGEIAFRPMGTGADKETDNGNVGQRSCRVFGMSGGHKRIATSHQYSHGDDYEQQHTFKLNVYYIDFLGQEFCVVTDTIQIEPFSGSRPVSSLPVFPFRFSHGHKETWSYYMSLGRQYIDFVNCRHAAYNWWTLTVTPKGEESPDVTGSMMSRPEFISGEVIIDFVEAFQTCPLWRPVPSILKSTDVDRAMVVDDFPICWWSDEDRSKLLFQTAECIVTKSGVTSWESNEYVMKKDKLLAKIRENDKTKGLLTAKYLLDDDLGILPSRLFAYALRERKFVQVDVSKLTKVVKTNDAFTYLKIKPKHKDLVQSLVDDHFRKKALGSRADISMDWIKGKGKGLFILLHGVPGVGKTATAEAIAQACGKPLFAITCGDLGLSPSEVESALRRIFRLANTWNCVLLLDEVDTFFSQRAMGDATLTKNALVSVFLRILEYYDGLLFLTTNRPGALDEAFKSRIHLTLYYPPLDFHQTMDIWRMNIDRLRHIERERSNDTGQHPMHISEAEILRFAEDTFQRHRGKFRWNGRQIRNAFQIASSLAHFDARRDQHRDGREDDAPPRLTAGHFKMIHTVTEDFDLYMQEAVGKPEGEMAFSRGERVQDNWDAEQARREHRLQNYGMGPSDSPGGLRNGSGGALGIGFGMQSRQSMITRRALSPLDRSQADSMDPLGMTSPTPLQRDRPPSLSLHPQQPMQWAREPSPHGRPSEDDRYEGYGRRDSDHPSRRFVDAEGPGSYSTNKRGHDSLELDSPLKRRKDDNYDS